MDILENQPQISSNRTRLEILASILNVSQHSPLKTHIMYKANLSHMQLEKYLRFLIAKGLLEELSDPERGGRFYQITEKGTEFLRDYARLSAHLGNATL
jgi:predicted transcriptional regulator